MKYVIHIDSFEMGYLKRLRAFINQVAPHVNDGLLTRPLVNWQNELSHYPYQTVEWYDDCDFLYYGHGADAGDTIIEIGKITLGEI